MVVSMVAEWAGYLVVLKELEKVAAMVALLVHCRVAVTAA